MEIKEKRVLITGANRGLGRAIALACLDAGAREVVAGVRHLERAGDLVAAAGTLGHLIIPVRLDVTSDDDAMAAASLGRVDILINNAGVCGYGGALKGALEIVRREMEVNYFGSLRLARAVAPAMVERGDGLIVNVASMLARVSLPAVGTYAATKAALLSLSQALRGDLGPHGVRVITVLPGTIDTDMARDYDIPKMPAELAALEILDAIRSEGLTTAIGDEARGVFERLAVDPVGMEQAFAEFRA
jgi:NAD(P)-dependent dehydrogenase (short-subunit alcohol dehydrogenase family)